MTARSPIVRYGMYLGYSVGTIVQGAGYAAYLLLSCKRVLEAGTTFFRDSVVRAFIVIFVIFLLCSVFSKAPTLANFLIENVKTLAWIGIAYVFASYRTLDLHRFIEFCRFFTVLGLILLPTQLDRFQGFYSHANHLAYVSSLLVAWTLVFDTRSARRITFVGLLLLGIFASKSSGGMVNALVAVGIGLLLAGRSSVRSVLTFIAAMVVLFYVAFNLGLLGTMLEKFTAALDADVLERAQAHAFGADGSFVWRVTYWTAIYLDFAKEGFRSALFGVGPGTMVAGNYFYDYMIVDPHNDYLRVLVERGWIGLSVFILIIFKLASISRYTFLFTLLIILQMAVGNVIVHLPTMVVFIAMIQYAIKRRNETEKSI